MVARWLSSMDDLGSLRADIARLRGLATKKVSRIKSKTGAVVSGSEFDPRRSPRAEGRYNRVTLERYQRELKGFLSRNSQFVGLSNHTPVPRSQWQEYKGLERQYVERVRSNFDRVSGVKLLDDQTVGERMAMATPRHKYMRNAAVNAGYDPQEREAFQVKDRKALNKLLADMAERAKPDWDKRMTEAARSNARKMLDTVGDDELSEMVDSLTDDQFWALWAYTPFISEIRFPYLKNEAIREGRTVEPFLATAAENTGDIKKLITWAKKLSL